MLKKFLNSIWQDDRSWQNRFLLAFMPSLLFAFTIFFVGPVDLIANNESSFAFTLSDTIWIIGITFVLVTIAITIPLVLLRGVCFNICVSLLFSLAGMAYIQGLFLNKDLGIMDGSDIDWGQYSTWSVINIIIWIAVALGVLILCFKFKKIWDPSIKYISGIMLAMQMVALFTLFTGLSDDKKNLEVNSYFSTENEFLLSTKENTVVFVLDWFSTDILHDTIQKYPDTMDAFHDFTRYDNYSTEVAWTFYSLSYFLTRDPFDVNKSYKDYLSQNWSAPQVETFYNALKDANYKSYVFSNPKILFQNGNQIEDKIDNMTFDKSSINHQEFIMKITKTSIFRYSPHAMKKCFWVSDLDYRNIVTTSNPEQTYQFDDPGYYNRLKTNGLSLQSDHNTYMFYHLFGAHLPLNMNEYCERVTDEVEREDQARGSLRIVEEYIRQMKELDIYDKSNIIITADHGANNGDNPNPASLFMLKRAGEANDVVQISNAPVAQADYWATLESLMSLDLKALDLGRPVFDWREDEERERTTYHWVMSKDYPDIGKRRNALGAWVFTRHALEVNMHTDEPSEVYPIIDSYY